MRKPPNAPPPREHIQRVLAIKWEQSSPDRWTHGPPIRPHGASSCRQTGSSAACERHQTVMATPNDPSRPPPQNPKRPATDLPLIPCLVRTPRRNSSRHRAAATSMPAPEKQRRCRRAGRAPFRTPVPTAAAPSITQRRNPRSEAPGGPAGTPAKVKDLVDLFLCTIPPEPRPLRHRQAGLTTPSLMPSI